MADSNREGFFGSVYEMVAQVPAGMVATYGQIAKLVGEPRRARYVGYALHVNPQPGVIPCHRIVFADGRLAEGFAFGGPEAQRTLLEDEGVAFLANGHVDLQASRSYDPIRCQEPQWPRRPLAIGRRGLPLNPSRSAPGMSSTPSAQSHIRGYRSVGPHSIPSAGFPKSVEAHAEGSARTAK